ncbi:MAG: tagatose 1,6-diphosphate aldolase [Anaerolineales bacterium]
MIITLSIGKWRGLQQCSTARGAIAIMALDQRNNLRQALNPESPASVTADEMTAFKQAVTAAVSPAATAALLDPEFGAAQCVASGALPGHIGLMVAVEATGYTGNPTSRQSQILPGWSVAKAQHMGASAVKLLVYYHPDSASAPEIEAFVKQVAGDCAASEIPLCLEPLSYSLDSSKKKLAPTELRHVVIESARRLVTPGVDVLKAEFPVEVTAEPDERAWEAACRDLTEASRAPWVLLSAGVSYDTYLRQVAVACRAGASGVAAGRAVWKEAAALTGPARKSFLRTTARERMARLTALCDALARPWTEVYTVPQVDETWHMNYS